MNKLSRRFVLSSVAALPTFGPCGVGRAEGTDHSPRQRSWRCAKPASSLLCCLLAECPNNLRLPVASNFSVARKRGHDIFVAQVLRPSLVFLGRVADLTAEKRQRLPKAVWVEVGQTGRREGVLENLPNGSGALPDQRFKPFAFLAAQPHDILSLPKSPSQP
jgi:hypothetical protein